MIRKLIDNTPSFYSRDKAEEIASILNSACDDDWIYKADHDPKGTGYSRVIIYNKCGEFIGYW